MEIFFIFILILSVLFVEISMVEERDSASIQPPNMPTPPYSTDIRVSWNIGLGARKPSIVDQASCSINITTPP